MGHRRYSNVVRPLEYRRYSDVAPRTLPGQRPGPQNEALEYNSRISSDAAIQQIDCAGRGSHQGEVRGFPAGAQGLVLHVAARRIAKVSEMKSQFVLLERVSLAALYLHSQAPEGDPFEAVLDQHAQDHAADDFIADFI